MTENYNKTSIIIKKLDKITLKDAIHLKIVSWTEELAGILQNDLDFEEEYSFWLDWMKSEKEHQDIRVLYGLFDNNMLIGAIFTSLAENHDHPNAVEINGLWINYYYRNKGLSKILINHALKVYQHLNKEAVVVYSHHYAPSNKYYLYKGGKVIRQDRQMDEKLLVDVFLFDYHKLFDKEFIKKMIF